MCVSSTGMVMLSATAIPLFLALVRSIGGDCKRAGKAADAGVVVTPQRCRAGGVDERELELPGSGEGKQHLYRVT